MPADAPRFYCPDLPQPAAAAPQARLDADESHHARRVLRLKPGAAVTLFDGRGGVADARLTAYDGRAAVCTVSAVERRDPPRPRLTVATAIPKGARAEAMVGQLSQAGVDRLVPVTSERSVVDPRESKLDRFARHAIESAKQCHRLHVMRVDPTQALPAVLAAGDAEVRLIAAPGSRAREGDMGLHDRLQRAGHVIVLIGPEGGFSDAELDAAAGAGFERWSLGPYVMRVETAAVAAATLVRYLAR